MVHLNFLRLEWEICLDSTTFPLPAYVLIQVLLIHPSILALNGLIWNWLRDLSLKFVQYLMSPNKRSSATMSGPNEAPDAFFLDNDAFPNPRDAVRLIEAQSDSSRVEYAGSRNNERWDIARVKD